MMSELIEAKDGQVYTVYSLAGTQYCIPGLKLNVCYLAEIGIGGVVLTISMKYPFTVTNKFLVTKNSSFDWNYGPVVIRNTISNFSNSGGSFSFDGNFRVIVNGFTFTGSHHFDNARLLKTAAEPRDAEFTNMLILQLLLDKESKNL